MATENIPSRLHCVAEGNVLAGANEILDDGKGKKQSVINQENNQRLETLETAVGTGGSVDSRIESAKTEIVGGASSDCNTLGKAEALISTNANDIAALQEAYAALTQNDVVVVTPSDTWPVASPAQNIIYRVVDRTNTPPQYYTDYMWNGTAMVEMAQYNNAIDAVPTAGSHNLVESGGVQNELALGAVYDVSAHNSNETFSSIEALLSDANLSTLIPTSVRKGGMSIKFVQSSDNKYVQYRLTTQSFSLIPSDWESTEDIQNRVNISELELLTPYETLEGYRIAYNSGPSDASVVSASFGTIFKYNVVAGKTYTFDVYQSGLIWGVVWWLNSNDEFIEFDYLSPDGLVDWKNKPIVAPQNATKAWFNIQTNYKNHHKFNLVGDVILSDNLKEQVEQNVSDIGINASNIAELQQKLTDTELNILTPFETLVGKRIAADDPYGTNPQIRDMALMSVRKYNVQANGNYTFSAYLSESYSFYVLFWFDSNGNHLRTDYQGTPGEIDEWIDKPVSAPENASQMWMNIINDYSDKNNFKSVSASLIDVEELKEQVEQNVSDIGINASNIAELQQKLTDTELNILTPFETLVGKRIAADDPYGTNPQIRDMSSMSVRKYNVQANGNYAFSAYLTEGWTFYVLFWFDANGNHLRTDYQGTAGEIDKWTDQPVVAPENASQMWMNILNDYADRDNFKSVSASLIDVEELKEQVEQNTADIEQIKVPKMMKVVINDLDGAVETTPFYIRSRYNESKDIIITHRVNSNGCVTFRDTYIGANTLTDEQLMQSSYLVSEHQDSTSPLYGVSQYWHLFAQHGYVIPYIDNPGLTNSDIGAEWKDQSERHYKIGNVSNDRVWLLPVIYTQDGHSVRDWKTPSSTAITTLHHVSGGSYTTDISVSGYGNTQLFPIMQKTNRIWRVDNKEVTEAGVYYCDELSVSESQIGYDPATVQTWFDSNGKVDLTGALPMAKLTYSFNYKGAQCCVNTTINILRSIDCTIYGGTQQQFFFDKGDYKAMFMIPKAKSRNGVDFEKPFNSPSSGSTGYVFYRDAASLNDVDDIIDRQIGFLKNPNTNDYLVGMAAGLSLVSGDTVKVKRNQNCLMGNTNTHYLVLNLSPANTNKFYVAAFNGSPYENNDYYLPAGFFKEVNYYVSYFDPAENKGQVYWYKDGNGYVIYAHCQSMQSALAIKVPDFMERLNLTIIEKTANTELLTDTIQNGKFFVNYNTTDANYIVLKAK